MLRRQAAGRDRGVRSWRAGAAMSLAAALCLPPGSGLAQAPTSSAEAACCGPVAPQGRRLIALIDSLHVEQAWLAHEHVNWETGAPDRAADYAGPGKATHCSAFAAAVGERLGVYMLRPPQHSQILLASAQTAWFHSDEGVRQGWRPLDGADRAQQAQAIANRGDLVVIAYESPDPHRPGHIVVVRPADKTAQALATDGPEIAMAGTRNYSDFIAAKAFRSHPGAWPDGVRYYWHAVDWSRIGG